MDMAGCIGPRAGSPRAGDDYPDIVPLRQPAAAPSAPHEAHNAQTNR